MTGGNVGALLCAAGASLRAAGIDNPRIEARLLLAHAMAASTESLLREPRAAVPPEAEARFRLSLDRRLTREPIALITGRAGFWTLDLEVTDATLVPRADSETLIEAALAERLAPARILDLGTGTGCLLLAALAAFPAARGVGVDRVAAAAVLARRNAARNGLSARAGFLVGDWAAALGTCFDLILSNPPYIETAAIAGLMPEVARHEPASALDGGPDGLDAYRAILAALPGLLAPGGRAILELGAGQGPAVSALAVAGGLAVRGMRDDLAGIPRAIILAMGRESGWRG